MTEPTRRPFPPLLIALGLAVLAVLAYCRVGQCGFVNLDDDAYVELQPLVNKGLRSAGIAWAFTGSQASNWHPLTTLSHMLDCTLFGLKPAPMHWENVLWHTLNSLLVFFAWRRLTGTLWRSAVVAAVFAVHPLHVESVAWLSERKDVLHAFFWLLGLLAYARFARVTSDQAPTPNTTPGRGVPVSGVRPPASGLGPLASDLRPLLSVPYLLVALALVFALLAKPMAVTFPCTLLLLDFWPLRRWPGRSWARLFLEKAPLFALVLIHSVLTFLVQHASGAANYGQRFPLGARLGNAFVAYMRYLGKTFWPETLSPFYYHPGYWPWPILLCGVLVVMAGTILAWRFWRTRPWLAVGWLWFLGTLVPVIGLVQVGAQSMADRYMYVPLLGIATIVAWEGAALVAQWPKLRVPLVAATGAALAVCVLLTVRQVATWKDSITLHRHSIAVGEDNPGVRYLLAVALAAAGRPEAEVLAQFHRALELQPDYVNAITQLAAVAIGKQQFDEAQKLVDQSVRYEPKNPSLHANLGALAVRRGKPDEAIRHFEEVLRLDPKSAGAHNELGQIYLNRQQWEEGRKHYEARARLNRWDADAQCDYGTLLFNMGRVEEGRRYLERALWLNPDHVRAKQNLAAALQAMQQPKR